MASLTIIEMYHKTRTQTLYSILRKIDTQTLHSSSSQSLEPLHCGPCRCMQEFLKSGRVDTKTSNTGAASAIKV